MHPLPPPDGMRNQCSVQVLSIPAPTLLTALQLIVYHSGTSTRHRMHTEEWRCEKPLSALARLPVWAQ